MAALAGAALLALQASSRYAASAHLRSHGGDVTWHSSAGRILQYAGSWNVNLTGVTTSAEQGQLAGTQRLELTVPSGVTTLRVALWGAGGGSVQYQSTYGNGGGGAYVEGNVTLATQNPPIVAGEKLYLVAGNAPTSVVNAGGGIAGASAGERSAIQRRGSIVVAPNFGGAIVDPDGYVTLPLSAPTPVWVQVTMQMNLSSSGTPVVVTGTSISSVSIQNIAAVTVTISASDYFLAFYDIVTAGGGGGGYASQYSSASNGGEALARDGLLWSSTPRALRNTSMQGGFLHKQLNSYDASNPDGVFPASAGYTDIYGAAWSYIATYYNLPTGTASTSVATAAGGAGGGGGSIYGPGAGAVAHSNAATPAAYGVGASAVGLGAGAWGSCGGGGFFGGGYGDQAGGGGGASYLSMLDVDHGTVDRGYNSESAYGWKAGNPTSPLRGTARLGEGAHFNVAVGLNPTATAGDKANWVLAGPGGVFIAWV